MEISVSLFYGDLDFRPYNSFKIGCHQLGVVQLFCILFPKYSTFCSSSISESIFAFFRNSNQRHHYNGNRDGLADAVEVKEKTLFSERP